VQVPPFDHWCTPPQQVARSGHSKPSDLPWATSALWEAINKSQQAMMSASL
jgi:hypothetical protein